jgi:hypothetical protein
MISIADNLTVRGGTMSDPFVAWLLAERRRWRDLSGPPTLAVVREYGVTRREIHKYLHATGWACDAPDDGDCPTRGPWQSGPPTWSHYEYVGTLDLRNDDLTIVALAAHEQRSPWEVLDDVSIYGGDREVYGDDGETLAATLRGPYIRRASDGALFGE